MKRAIFLLVGFLCSLNAWSYSASAQVICASSSDSLVATLKVDGNVSSEHMGLPGLIYIALYAADTQTSIFYSQADNRWVEYQGGQYPIARVVRGGLGPFVIPLDVSNYLNPRYAVYVGYGALLPMMESNVQTRRASMNKVQSMYPNKSFYDPGDDFVRRALIENDMSKQGRYFQVLPMLSCS